MEEAVRSFNLAEAVKFLPETVVPILITLALSFLIGLEREESSGGRRYNFGGVRTFPIIGLCGYLMARLTDGQPLVIGIGVLVIGALMWLSYRKKLQISQSGLTSEVSGLFTFLLGALVFRGALWEATTLAVLVLLLLEWKEGLEALARKLPAEEIFTFTRFLLISAVILPIVPDREITNLHFNPFHTWLIVVVISGLSYGVYVVERIFDSKRSVLLASILGGLYSSTSTTVVLAKESADSSKPDHLLTGGIVLASGFMYFRLIALLSIFNWDLAKPLLAPLSIMGVVFCVVGGVWMNFKGRAPRGHHTVRRHARNPLALRAAFLFAFMFSAMGVLTVVAIQYFGSTGVFSLAFLSGLIDVDPFVMSLTQSAKAVITHHYAIVGVLVSTASNNVMKGIYAAILGKDGVRAQASLVMITLAFLSLLSLFMV